MVMQLIVSPVDPPLPANTATSEEQEQFAAAAALVSSYEAMTPRERSSLSPDLCYLIDRARRMLWHAQRLMNGGR